MMRNCAGKDHRFVTCRHRRKMIRPMSSRMTGCGNLDRMNSCSRRNLNFGCCWSCSTSCGCCFGNCSMSSDCCCLNCCYEFLVAFSPPLYNFFGKNINDIFIVIIITWICNSSETYCCFQTIIKVLFFATILSSLYLSGSSFL